MIKQEAMERCVKNTQLCKYVNHFARKIHRVFPKYLEVSDGENELWTRLFEAISKKYLPDIPLFQFAKRQIFSAYGHITRNCGNMARFLHEEAFRFGDSDVGYLSCVDSSYVEFEATFTLNQIEDDLKNRESKARQYRSQGFLIAADTHSVSLFSYLREGHSINEYGRYAEIPVTTCYRIFNQVIRPTAKKYCEV